MAMLTTTEAAKRMGFAPSTLRHWRTKNTGPAYSRDMVHGYRYDEDDIDEYLREHSPNTPQSEDPQP